MNDTRCSCNCSAKDVGIMIIRVGVGACFIAHGLSKIHTGQPHWGLGATGHAMEYFGIHRYFAVWGLLNVLAEAGGGVLLVLGFLVRPAAFVMALNMTVAITFPLHSTDPMMSSFGMWSHPLEDGIIF